MPYVRTMLFSALVLSACSAEQNGNRSAAQPSLDSVSGQTGQALTGEAAEPATASLFQPPADCGRVQESQDRENILGVGIGMTPVEAAAVLSCRGYRLAYPVNANDERQVERETEAGIFRFDFTHPASKDYVRLFAEGPDGQRKVFYVGRTSTFGENPPTMEAVARQFLDRYALSEAITRDSHGNVDIVHASFGYRDTSKAQSAAQNECIGRSRMHDPDMRYSLVTNSAPGPDINCGASLNLQVIQDGQNPSLALLARYRMANPRLAQEWQQQRVSGAQSATRAKAAADTKRAEESGALPDL